jgi:hypothetical protein
VKYNKIFIMEGEGSGGEENHTHQDVSNLDQ